MADPQPFESLRELGLLWLINTTVFHPRGYALVLHLDDETGQATGWSLAGDGSEPWMFADDPETHARFAAAQALLAGASRG